MRKQKFHVKDFFFFLKVLESKEIRNKLKIITIIIELELQIYIYLFFFLYVVVVSKILSLKP